MKQKVMKTGWKLIAVIVLFTALMFCLCGSASAEAREWTLTAGHGLELLNMDFAFNEIQTNTFEVIPGDSCAYDIVYMDDSSSPVCWYDNSSGMTVDTSQYICMPSGSSNTNAGVLLCIYVRDGSLTLKLTNDGAEDRILALEYNASPLVAEKINEGQSFKVSTSEGQTSIPLFIMGTSETKIRYNIAQNSYSLYDFDDFGSSKCTVSTYVNEQKTSTKSLQYVSASTVGSYNYYCAWEPQMAVDTNNSSTTIEVTEGSAIFAFSRIGWEGTFRYTTEEIDDDAEWTETEKQLSTPAISPASGIYTNAVSVSASGPDGSTLHYTTDGTVPTINSPIWPDDGLSVTKTTTVMVMAAKNGCEDSIIASATYQISFTVAVAVNDPIQGGTVTADKELAEEGETVTLTVMPETGYALSSLTYTYTPVGGTETTETVEAVDGVYAFTMPAGNVTVSAVFTEWAWLNRQFANGGTVTLTKDYTAAPTDTHLYVPAGKTVTLDLNGHTLDYSASTEGEYGAEGGLDISRNGAIVVFGTLTIQDSGSNGTITGGTGENAKQSLSVYGTCAMQSGTLSGRMSLGDEGDQGNGSFTMTGGTIDGIINIFKNCSFSMTDGCTIENTKITCNGAFTMDGGSISGHDVNQVVTIGGTFTMSGGTISGTGITDCVVQDIGNFTMSGGEVSGSGKYGGVFASGPLSFHVSGAPRISSVYLHYTTGTDSDEEVGDYVTIETFALVNVDGPLTSGASIPVITAAKPKEGRHVVITSGLTDNGGETAANAFTCNMEGLMLEKYGDELAVTKPAATDWDALQALIEAGGTVTLDRNYTATPADDTLTIPSWVNVVLDLNGHTVDGSALDGINVIKLEVGGYHPNYDPTTLTITDSSSGGKLKCGMSSAVEINQYSEFYMNNGTIEGAGSNIVRTTSTSGEFHMSGGTITGTLAAPGAYSCVVYMSGGNFTMTGGAISGTGYDSVIHNVGSESYRSLLSGGTITGINVTRVMYLGFDSDFTVSGGTINGNGATYAVYVDPVYQSSISFIVSGSPAISGAMDLGGSNLIFAGKATLQDVQFSQAGNITARIRDGYPDSIIKRNGEAITANDDGTFTIPVTTDPQTLTVESQTPLTHADISYDTSSQTYTGDALTIPVRHLGRLLEEGTDYTVTYTKDGEPAELKDAGTYTVTFNGIGAYTGEKEVTLTINPASVTLTANSRDTDVYDGTEKTVTGFTASVDGLIFAETVTAGVSGTDAGDYDVTFSGVTVNETTDTTGNYVVIGTTDGKLTIAQKPATVTAKAQTVVLGSSIATGPDQATLTNAVEGHTLTAVTLTASSTETATTEGTITPGAATIMNGETDVTANYAITYESGTLTVLQTYAVTIDDTITGGTVAAGKDLFVEGETSTLTVTPDTGYMLVEDSLTVMQGDTAITVTNNQFTMPAGEVTVSAAFVPDLTQWAGLQAAFDTASKDENNPTIIKLTQDVTATDADECLLIPPGRYVVLDLNGHNIDRGLTSAKADGNVFTVKRNLTVTDSSENQSGMIKGGRNRFNGGGVYVDGGSFTMTGGSVSYNTAEHGGGGVYVFRGSFTMSGGSVSDNTALDGGGIYVNNGNFNVFGTPRITGNVKGGTISNGVLSGGTTENVYLRSGKVVTVTGELTDAASIGVTMQNPGVFTSGLSDNGTAANFVSDSTAYAAGLVNGEAKLSVPYNVTIADTIRYGSAAAEKTRAIAGETVTLTVTPDAGYELGTLTYSYTKTGEEELTTETVPSGSISQNKETGVYTATFEMPAYPVTVNATFTINSNDFKKTDDNEYTIYTAGGWNVFCDLLADNDKGIFDGKTVKLDGSIEVSRMAGSSHHDFTGTFNGQGKTLTVNYTATEQYAAPFRNVENGCVIENLHVAGTITTSSQNAAGIAGNQFGTVIIRNCRVSVTIRSSVAGDGTHGGLVAVKGNSNSANLTIENCVFDGKIVSTGTSATTKCGGFVGWKKDAGTLTITNSIYAPTADDNAVSDGETFARNWTMPQNANCYYTATLGDAQGEFIGLLTLPDGVTASAAEGDTVSYDKKTWYIGGRTVTLTVTPPEGFVLAANGLRVSWADEDSAEQDVAATQGTGDDADKWSFEMPDHNVTVTAVFIPSAFGTPDFTLPEGLTTIEESAFEGVAGMTIVDASHCTSIGAFAFKDTGLTQIRLPGTCEINDTAFYGLEQVYVFAPAGSTQDFCNAHNNLVFVEETEEPLSNN